MHDHRHLIIPVAVAAVGVADNMVVLAAVYIAARPRE